MNIFNTKKSRAEWERKIEESYLRGKKDAEDEILSQKSTINEETIELKKLSEKELLCEIIKSVNIQNKRIDNLNSKISFVMDYKMIFKEMNNLLNEIMNKEKHFSENISEAQNNITDLKSNIVGIKTSIIELENILNTLTEDKSILQSTSDEIRSIIPKLKNMCVDIENIEENTNQIILNYEDSPIETLNTINKKLGIDDDAAEFTNINSKLENIESIVNDALDDLGYRSLYTKIDELKNQIYDLDRNLNNNSNY